MTAEIGLFTLPSCYINHQLERELYILRDIYFPLELSPLFLKKYDISI